MTQNIKTIALAALLACGLPAVAATPIQLKFEGLSLKAYDPVLEKDSIRDVLVDDFYKAGGSSKEVSDGTKPVQPGREDLGVVFDGPAIATASSDTGGVIGLFTRDRLLRIGDKTILSQELGTGAAYALGPTSDEFGEPTSFIVDPDLDFDTGLSFFYNGEVTIDVTTVSGAVLSKSFTAVIPERDQCTEEGNTSCLWIMASFAFTPDVKARSVKFSGAEYAFLVDNITLGGLDPLKPVDPGVPAIPEPSTYALMALGLAAVGYTARRRKLRG